MPCYGSAAHIGCIGGCVPDEVGGKHCLLVVNIGSFAILGLASSLQSRRSGTASCTALPLASYAVHGLVGQYSPSLYGNRGAAERTVSLGRMQEF